MEIIGLTVVAILSREMALKGVRGILERMDADPDLKRVAERREALVPYPPPGADSIVASREPFKNSEEEKVTQHAN